MLCQIKSRSSGQVLEKHFIHSKVRVLIQQMGHRGTKVLLNDHDHMTKRAATPIYGNTFFYRNTGLIGPLQ